MCPSFLPQEAYRLEYAVPVFDPLFLTSFEEILNNLLKFELAQSADFHRKVSASSVGKMHLLLPGPAVLDPTITSSPYSNTLDFVDATLSVDADDILFQNEPQDTASLSALVTLALPGSSLKNQYAFANITRF